MSNNEIIEKYSNHLKDVEKLKSTTLKSERYLIDHFKRKIKYKHFKQVKQNDIIAYLKLYNPTTYDERLRKLKKFYNWLYQLEKNQYPDCIKDIKPHFKNPLEMYRQNIGYKERVVIPEEYQSLIDNSNKIMHKAIIETLYLFGCRSSELLNMNSNDVYYDGEFTRATFTHSKELPRENVYYGRAEHLLRWAESYQPFKGQKNQPLWVTPAYKDKKTKQTLHNTRFTINGLEKALKVISKRANTRQVTPHDFRHTRVTIECKKGTPQTHIEKNLGFRPGTMMMEVYDHNKTKDYEDYLKQKQVDTPATYELLKKQKETLEQKHEKEIQELKQQQEQLFKIYELFNKTGTPEETEQTIKELLTTVKNVKK